MRTPLTVGNGQAFWGDSPDGALDLIHSYPLLDYLTLDYLSKVSLSIMAVQRESNLAHDYMADCVALISALIL